MVKAWMDKIIGGLKMNLKSKIEEYVPYDEIEAKDKEYFLKWINTFEDVLTRNNEFGHITASAFVVNEDKTKMLVVYHNIYDNWIYPSGHADGEEDLLSVAVREVLEETGLKVKVLDNSIYAIAAYPTIGHIKRGKYVSAHTHLDVVFILEGNDKEPLKIKEDENKGVKWIPLEEAYGNNIVDFTRPTNKRMIKKLKS